MDNLINDLHISALVDLHQEETQSKKLNVYAICYYKCIYGYITDIDEKNNYIRHIFMQDKEYIELIKLKSTTIVGELYKLYGNTHHKCLGNCN